MLVLSRKLGERVVVPQCDLAITVVAIEGKTVRLGISAPSAVGVYREELWRAIREQPVPSAAASVRIGAGELPSDRLSDRAPAR